MPASGVGVRDDLILHLSELTVEVLRRYGVEPIHWNLMPMTDIEFDQHNFLGYLAEHRAVATGSCRSSPPF